MTIRPAVLYLDLSGLDVQPGVELLQSAGIEVLHVADQPSAEQLARVVAVLAGYDPVTDELLARLPALRLVATHSAGYDMVDLAAARARGVLVTNVPASAVDEVAVHALAMALSLLRGLSRLDRDVRAGRWDGGIVRPPRAPGDLTCGVVGLGRIGRRFAELARPLFGRLVGHDPALESSQWPEGVARLGWHELLEVADCISLHLPLTEETRGLVDRAALARLPRDAVLVNVSRGGLVDEDALLAALEAGHLGGAALDVRRIEPNGPDDVLAAHEGVISTPHVAYLSPAALRRYAEIPARNVLALLETGRPLDPIDLADVTTSAARTTP